MYFWGYRQFLQSNSDSVTLFESSVQLGYVGLWCWKRYHVPTYSIMWKRYLCIPLCMLLYIIYGVEQKKEVHGVLALTLIICVSCNVVDMTVGFVSSWF